MRLPAILRVAAIAGVLLPLFGLRSGVAAQTVLSAISLSYPPGAVVVNPTTHRIYVTDPTGNAVVAIDGETGALVDTIPLGVSPAVMAIDPTANRLYVAGGTGNGSVDAIDLKTDAIASTIPVGISPIGLVVDPATDLIYVVDGQSFATTVIDGTTNTVVNTLPNTVGAIALDPAAGQLYIADDRSGVLSTIDLSTSTVTLSTSEANASALAVSAKSGRLYLATVDPTSSHLLVLDPSDFTILASVPVGANPDAVAIDPSTNHVYVANHDDNTVTVVDGATSKVLETLAVGQAPVGIAVDPGTRRVYVANAGSNNLSVIDDTPPNATPAPPVPHDSRYFPQTGFRIDDDTIYDYFLHRGGIRNFGYPISRTFLFQGNDVQFFQRRIVEVDGQHHPRLLNLLDPGLMPYNSFNQAVMPSLDESLVTAAPAPTNVGAMLAFVRDHAPDRFSGIPVNFYQTFASTVRATDAFPNGKPILGLLDGFDLEMWGLPTSAATFDPTNHHVVYLRFQRGIMMYDAGCHCTQAVLLGDYFKSILTGQHLPADVAAEAQDSPFFEQYDPTQSLWVHDTSLLPNTDLRYAFTPG